MSISKSLLWVVNIVIAVIISAGGAVLYYTSKDAVSKEWMNDISVKESLKDTDGSSSGVYSAYEIDINYAFKSKGGKVLMDNYFLRFNNISVVTPSRTGSFDPRYPKQPGPPKVFDAQKDWYEEDIRSVMELYIPVEKREIRFVLIIRVFVYTIFVSSALYVLFGLRRFIIRSVEGDFFNPGNHLLLMRAGIVLCTYSIVHFLFYRYFEVLVVERMEQALKPYQSIWFDYRFLWEFAACGLLLLLISLAFRQGTMLKREQELTI